MTIEEEIKEGTLDREDIEGEGFCAIQDHEVPRETGIYKKENTTIYITTHGTLYITVHHRKEGCI